MGKVLTATGTPADINIRCRGYYYDDETGLYYLQSRYYDAEIGRFINADDTDYIGADGGVLSYNLFAYCQNNPCTNSDRAGTFINTLTGLLVGGIIGAINAAVSGDNIWAGAAIGAMTGTIAGFTADVAISTGGVCAIAIATVGGALASGLNYGATEKVNGRDIKWDELAVEMMIGAVANLLTFGVGGGSLSKVSGNPINNMTNALVETVMKNKTKRVAGKTVYKTAKSVAKNVTKNILAATTETATISGGAYLNSIVWKGILK